MACGILGPPAVKVQVPATGPPGNSLEVARSLVAEAEYHSRLKAGTANPDSATYLLLCDLGKVTLPL